MTATLTRRLAALEAGMGAVSDGPPLICIDIERWDPADRETYDAADGPDADAIRARLITAYTGETPGARTTVIAFRLVPGGPE